MFNNCQWKPVVDKTVQNIQVFKNNRYIYLTFCRQNQKNRNCTRVYPTATNCLYSNKKSNQTWIFNRPFPRGLLHLCQYQTYTKTIHMMCSAYRFIFSLQAVERDGGKSKWTLEGEGALNHDPPASDLLALHVLVFRLSLPFGHLPRRLVHFHMKRLATLRLVFKQKHKVTRLWPIKIKPT